MGVSESIKNAPEVLFQGWRFEVVDVKGRLGGLEIGWRTRVCRGENMWSFESGICLEIFSKEMGRELTIISIYGPSQNIVEYCETLLNRSFLIDREIIIDGDLNFTIGAAKV